ncbi:MAG: serine hydrolase domain-containing protein [Candidatus Aminicenantales bacterium]
MNRSVAVATPVLLIFLASAVCQGVSRAQVTAGPADLRDKLERYLDQSAEAGFAFSALVSMDGRVIVQSGSGWLDSARTVRATPRTLFNLASITKSFTAVAVLMLREQGLLGLGDALTKFLADVPKDKAAVTLEQLLLHTSGLGQNYLADGMAERDKAAAAILRDPLKFPPGTGFSYSNENYELLAAVIEVVSGRSYERYVRDNVLTRAGMADTRFWDETAGLPPNAVAPMTRALEPANLGHNWGYIGSGGIYSNIVDLPRWFEALASGRLLNKNSLEMMWAPRRQLTDTGVALGWFVSKAPDGTAEIWTRGSEDWGHNGVVRWFPARRTLVIVQSNSGERGDKNITANRSISDGIVALLFDRRGL